MHNNQFIDPIQTHRTLITSLCIATKQGEERRKVWEQIIPQKGKLHHIAMISRFIGVQRNSRRDESHEHISDVPLYGDVFMLYMRKSLGKKPNHRGEYQEETERKAVSEWREA